MVRNTRGDDDDETVVVVDVEKKRVRWNVLGSWCLCGREETHSVTRRGEDDDRDESGA